MPGLIPGFPLLNPDMEAKSLSKRPRTHAPILKRTLNDTVGIVEGSMLLPDSILRGREAVCPVVVVDNGAGQTCCFFQSWLVLLKRQRAETRNGTLSHLVVFASPDVLYSLLASVHDGMETGSFCRM